MKSKNKYLITASCVILLICIIGFGILTIIFINNKNANDESGQRQIPHEKYLDEKEENIISDDVTNISWWAIKGEEKRDYNGVIHKVIEWRIFIKININFSLVGHTFNDQVMDHAFFRCNAFSLEGQIYSGSYCFSAFDIYFDGDYYIPIFEQDDLERVPNLTMIELWAGYSANLSKDDLISVKNFTINIKEILLEMGYRPFEDYFHFISSPNTDDEWFTVHVRIEDDNTVYYEETKEITRGEYIWLEKVSDRSYNITVEWNGQVIYTQIESDMLDNWLVLEISNGDIFFKEQF